MNTTITREQFAVQKIRDEVERLMYGYNLEADIASDEDAETENSQI